MNIGHTISILWLRATNVFCKTYTASICKHKTKQRGVVKFGRDVVTMSMPYGEDNQPEYCLACIAKMTIRCAWCGLPIYVGDPIILGIPMDEFKVPDYAVRYTENESEALIGCLRWRCGDAVNMCGRWMPPGKVERFPSPIEMALNNNATVLISDVQNYPESATLFSENK